MSEMNLNRTINKLKSEELNFFKLRDQFYEKYALLHSSHLLRFVPSTDKKEYFFILKKRYSYLLHLAFSSQQSLLNTKSSLYWEFKALLEELLLWSETSSCISKLSMKYRGHEEFLNFLTLVKELKEEKKKSGFFSFFPDLKLSH